MLRRFFAAPLLLMCGLTSPNAHATLIVYSLTDPDSNFNAVFTYREDAVLDGVLDSRNLESIRGDFGDGLFTYQFASVDDRNELLYDPSDLSLIRFVNGFNIFSSNTSASGALTYEHAFFDLSAFILGGQPAIVADWDGDSSSLLEDTDLNIPNSAVPVPTTLGLMSAGIVLVRRRIASP